MINSPGATSIYPQFDRLDEKKSRSFLSSFLPTKVNLCRKTTERTTFLFFFNVGGLWKYSGQQVPNRPGVPSCEKRKEMLFLVSLKCKCDRHTMDERLRFIKTTNRISRQRNRPKTQTNYFCCSFNLR